MQGQLSVLREHSRALEAARFARTSGGVVANQPDSAVHVAKRNAQAYGSMPPAPKRLLLTAPFTPSESVLESVPSSTERPQLSKTDAQGPHNGQPALTLEQLNSLLASSPLPSAEVWHGGYEEQPALTLEQFNPLFASSPLWSGKPLQQPVQVQGYRENGAAPSWAEATPMTFDHQDARSPVPR
ncbi:hypothetical protein [Mycetohabitans endofungorum]|uniref:hypothetical protein n=1 Tax=Mycetohabitans endofungorum TaxID=417203 RepID=UPI002B0565ED|nr:hypothetical protein [Mycetohabitans endofungorum]